jgi:alkanesulfonate monooxygenase SsuD/methylene tetrahydromethanopterin reductase-like flavin-dependent oxidoreductase (luciferase family)
VLAFNHSPVMTAFAAMDLDFLSGGRFILGLGAAHPNRNNNWYGGRDAGKPVSQMREYVEVLRAVMDTAAGGNLRYDGTYYHVDARGLFPRSLPPPRPRVPIYLASVKPRMTALAGEVADGVIGNPMFSPRHVREVILPPLGEGLARAGRRREQIEVLGQCFTVIDDDLATAYQVGAGAMLFNIWARIYDDIFAAHGFGGIADEVRALQRTGDRARAIERIPRELVDTFCAVGPVDRVRAKVAEREGLLDTVILAVPSTGRTRAEQDHYRDRILTAFGA